jgi:hypothetical protein
MTYTGDGGHPTFRAHQAVTVVPGTGAGTGDNSKPNNLEDTGVTMDFGAGTPKIPPNLSQADMDGIPRDCVLWNDTAQANPHQDGNAMSEVRSFPSATQAQAEISGQLNNPLSCCKAPIVWDMKTTVDTSSGAPMASVNFNHTCYPSHIVTVNGKTVYQYTPPESGGLFVFKCLSGISSHVTGQTQSCNLSNGAGCP